MAGGRATDWLSRAAWFAGLWALAHLLAVALTYQVYPGHLDHNESSLVALTRLMIDGHTVYGGFDSPDRVSHAHGPMTFLWHALPQLLFGGGTGAGRAGATAATLLVPLVMAATALARGTVPALLALSLGSAGILLHLNLSIVVRPDGPITLLVACAVLLAARSGKGLVASLLMGLCMGAVVAFKINAGLYLVPVVLYHVAADPIRRLAVIGAVSAAVAALPFAFDAFPPAEYLSMLAGVAGKENTWRGFTALWWKFALYLTIPPAIWLAGGRAAWAATDRPTKAYLAAYL
ncbi:MAG TPA: hypothetical protein VLL76_05765, partial [Candidatus Omnitrophota bacterium]|nr:hypothetical protein [Candidatus Omnitrophota bacterium]